MDVLSVVVDGEQREKIPDRGPHRVEVNCGETKGEWDYNAWTLNLANITENTRCNISFASNALTDAEYQEYLEAGKSLRRNTYRGKVLSGTLKETRNGKEVKIEGEYTLDQVYAMISDGTFSDIYVGDVIVSNGITWLVADIDNYLYTGDSGNELKKHHLTIISATPLAYSGMNTTNAVYGAYYNSEMVQGKKENSGVSFTLIDALKKVEDGFGEYHVLEYRNMLSNETITSIPIEAFDSTGAKITLNIPASSGGYVGFIGASSNWDWYTRKIDLMSEVNVYGTTVWSSSGYDTGIDNKQYAIFRLKPEYIHSYNGLYFPYWLKSMAAYNLFVHVNEGGIVGREGSSVHYGIRPRFLIG